MFRLYQNLVFLSCLCVPGLSEGRGNGNGRPSVPSCGGAERHPSSRRPAQAALRAQVRGLRFEHFHLTGRPGMDAAGHTGFLQVHPSQGVLFPGRRRVQGPTEGLSFLKGATHSTRTASKGGAEFHRDRRSEKSATATPPHLHRSVPVQGQVRQGVWFTGLASR